MATIHEKIRTMTIDLQRMKEMCEESPHLLFIHAFDIQLLENTIHEMKIQAEEGQ